MNVLYEWAEENNISEKAMNNLINMVTKHVDNQDDLNGSSEAVIQKRTMLRHSKKGGLLFRNNVGCAKTDNGFIRYGLANESKKMNEMLKSSDLIGIKKIKIKKEMVGQVVGVFLAREVKKSDWKYSGNEREVAQLNFITRILAFGGDAKFTNNGEF